MYNLHTIKTNMSSFRVVFLEYKKHTMLSMHTCLHKTINNNNHLFTFFPTFFLLTYTHQHWLYISLSTDVSITSAYIGFPVCPLQSCIVNSTQESTTVQVTPCVVRDLSFDATLSPSAVSRLPAAPLWLGLWK